VCTINMVIIDNNKLPILPFTILRINKVGYIMVISVCLEVGDLYPCSVVMVPNGAEYQYLYNGVTY
jgi:hypothetical protein